MCCSVLRCVAVCCSMHGSKSEVVPGGQMRSAPPCTVVCRIVLLCVAVCCSCGVSLSVAVCRSVLQCVPVCRTVLLCVAVCCSVLQRVAV